MNNKLLTSRRLFRLPLFCFFSHSFIHFFFIHYFQSFSVFLSFTVILADLFSRSFFKFQSSYSVFPSLTLSSSLPPSLHPSIYLSISPFIKRCFYQYKTHINGVQHNVSPVLKMLTRINQR
mgnify:CR=1 FL=1